MVVSDKEVLAILLLKRLIKSGNPDMDLFLTWIWARLKNVYHEHEDIDYMQALKRYAEGINEIKRELL